MVESFTRTQKKVRSPVSWRQAKRREHRLQQKFFPFHSPPSSARPCTGTSRIFGVSGLLGPPRSKWSSFHMNLAVAPASSPSSGPKNVENASASPAPVQNSPGHQHPDREEVHEAHRRTHKARGVWMSCASPEAAAGVLLAQAPEGCESRAPRDEQQHFLVSGTISRSQHPPASRPGE